MKPTDGPGDMPRRVGKGEPIGRLHRSRSAAARPFRAITVARPMSLRSVIVTPGAPSVAEPVAVPGTAMAGKGAERGGEAKAQPRSRSPAGSMKQGGQTSTITSAPRSGSAARTSSPCRSGPRDRSPRPIQWPSDGEKATEVT